MQGKEENRMGRLSQESDFLLVLEKTHFRDENIYK